MTTRNCDSCGKPYEAKRASSKFCGDTCRKRAQRDPAPPSAGDEVVPHDTPPSGALLEAVRAELIEGERLDTALGAQALEIAARMSSPFETGSSIASLSRELRAVMNDALKNAKKVADPVDELRQRRDRKWAG